MHILSSCSHAGFVDDGLRHFDAMSKLHGMATGRRRALRLHRAHRSKTGLQNRSRRARGLIARYYIVEGVKYATLKLRGCCIGNLKVVGVI
jgi:hypothetical protein